MGAIWLPADLRPATREVVNITAGERLGPGILRSGKVGGKSEVFGARSTRVTYYYLVTGNSRPVTGRQ